MCNCYGNRAAYVSYEVVGNAHSHSSPFLWNGNMSWVHMHWSLNGSYQSDSLHDNWHLGFPDTGRTAVLGTYIDHWGSALEKRFFVG